VSTGRARQRAALGTALVAVVLVALGVLPSARAVGSAPALDEGPLRNESRVPVDEGARAAFEAADARFVAARTSGGDLEPIFDAWVAALSGADRLRAVPLVPAAGEAPSDARLFEGPEVALQRRVGWLDSAERARWREHTEPLAERRLAASGGAPAALAALERELPGTRAGLRAGLMLCDRAAAEGAVAVALGWLDRVQDALGLLDGAEAAPWREAVARRRTALLGLATPRAAGGRDPVAAGGLESAGAFALEDPLGPGPRVVGLAAGPGLFPGLVVLDDGRWVVQTASRVHVLDTAELRVLERFEPTLLVQRQLGAPYSPFPSSAAPGWRLAPASDGEDLLLVEGRLRVGASGSNLLVRVAPPPLDRPDDIAVDVGLARPVWARSAGGHLRPDGSVAPLPDASGIEFQPGPVLVGAVAAVHLRRGSGEIEAALQFVDWGDGTLIHERTLVVGREVGPDLGRFSAAPARGAGSPLLAHGTRVLAVTNLGVVALVDALDGRLLWSLRTQRQDGSALDAGFTGVRQVLQRGVLHVAPADSDRVYQLPVGPFRGAAPGPDSLGAPLERGETLFLVGPGPGERLVTATRRGPRQALALLDPRDGAELPGVFLPLGEALCEGAHVSADGHLVVAAGERHVYLFDGRRELFLVDERPLDDPRAPRPRGRSPALGGSVHAAGGLYGVLSSDALVLFRARRANPR
jgi:hypothetical protein